MSAQASTAAPRTVTVLGAGIVGLCCALALQRAGCSVTLIDRDTPGAACSFGNAGMIQTGSISPLAQPGILREVPGMLFRHDGPLALRWSQLPRLMPWFAAFLREANANGVENGARALMPWLRAAKAAYLPLLEAAEATSLMVPRGELYVFRAMDAAQKLAAKFALYRRHGVRYLEMNAAALRRFEPALAAEYRYGYYLPDSEYVLSPIGLSTALAACFCDNGGVLLRRDVKAVRRTGQTNDAGVALVTDGASPSCEALVIAAGAASERFARMLGLRMLLAPLRGYHLMLQQDLALQGPVIEGEMNFAATPMLDGVRLAGTVEFAGENAAANWRRAEMLAPMARAMLPGLRGTETSRWFGERPGTPDGLPLLGPLPGLPRVWCATGHGMLGLTLGAVTGRAVAEGLLGHAASLDARPFRPERFSPHHR